MIVVSLDFKYVEISKYSRDESRIKICFNDGFKDHIIEKKVDYDNVEEFTDSVINEARTIAKQQNSQKGSGVLGDMVSIRFTHDEEEVFEKLDIIFSRIKDEIRKARTTKTAQNYLQMISNLQGSKYNL